MAQYIKKVGVTPTRANGFIIDSFNTGDDPHYNAPSIYAVQQKLNGIASEFSAMNDEIELRADNNLLFAGDFRALSQGGSNVNNGWTLTRNSGTGNMSWASVVGIVIGANTSITVRSPMYTAQDSTFAVHPISVSVLYRQMSGSGTLVDKIARWQNIQPPYTIGQIPTYVESGVINMKITQVYGGYFALRVTTENYMVSVKAIKVEYGATCTDIATAGRDAGIVYALSQLKNSTAPLDYIVTQSFATPSATIGAGARATVQGEVTKTGYNPIGIISYKPIFTEGFVLPCTFAIATVDGVKKAQFMVYNPGSGSATFQMQCTVLYIKE